MDLLVVLCHLLLFLFDASAATSLITGTKTHIISVSKYFSDVWISLFMTLCWTHAADIFEARGQRVCKAGRGKPCYKLAYFSELRRRLNFAEAELACRRDGGQLLSVESLSEQKVIEQLIKELRPTDGDFWIGLRRNHGNEESMADCSAQYYWLDGSRSTFRNWHWDEPSCGYEVCVVMYHQPSAPAGMGGLYMFQWNDDNCETKNNFICKYTAEEPSHASPSPNTTLTAVLPSSMPWNPHGKSPNRSPAMNLVYIIIPTIPLILLLLTVTGVCCFKMIARRRRKEHKSDVSQPEPGLCSTPTPTDVYNVIRSQKDDDLVSTRPHTKNTSFLCSSPDTPTGDYDNLGGRDTESGFVTLASTESCFLNFDLNDLTLGRRGARDFYDTSLGRPAKRDSSESRPGQFYDRSLGRRTTKSEHYGTGTFPDHGLYDGGVRRGSDLYDPNSRPGCQTVKADLFQTYVSNGKDNTFQTNLGTYAQRKPFQTNLDCYSNLDGGRYFNEREWMNRDNY
ncbi:layilin [Synchiropus splendidus]|uniref:layilin n=1 Tax=Synchiropus splendidus TaxID=270530 RepID=UPI00237E7713|nr:layilin [Synchiropus splendidus]